MSLILRLRKNDAPHPQFFKGTIKLRHFPVRCGGEARMGFLFPRFVGYLFNDSSMIVGCQDHVNVLGRKITGVLHQNSSKDIPPSSLL